MTSMLNRWFRRIHRWFAVPTAISIPLAVALKLLGGDAFQQAFRQWEAIQSLLMLTLALTGAYLFLLPYYARWKRSRRAVGTDRS
jgi:hypothetical protein